ncbi:MAG: crotonase/enoyl-CoA hydratase family protein [Leucobacter sp.]|nr:crotonase/enoyl-CoA hydratase family protein [Leucobacter sp.]
MAYETLDWHVGEDGVALLTLNRPDKLNAFDLIMGKELLQVFGHDALDDAVKAVVVTGAGRAFCAGMDLDSEQTAGGNVFGVDESLMPNVDEFYERYGEEPYATGVRDFGGRISLAIHHLPEPVIAAINGAAVGLGATMTLAMDIRLASTAARVGFVFGRIGIVPEACSSWFLPRIVGMQQALEWVYSADVLNADEVLAGRLVRSVHEPEDLVPQALELARSFVNNRSPVALGLAKQLLYGSAGLPTPFDTHLADSLAMYYSSIGDGKEGVAAFLEKRAPHFTSSSKDIPRIFR